MATKQKGLPTITRKQLMGEAEKVLEEVPVEKAAEYLAALAVITLRRRSSSRRTFYRRSQMLQEFVEKQIQDAL